jgi:hypothetical protein
MRRLPPIIVLLAVLAAAPAASAKGPTHAEISGPGLAHPIVFNGFGEPGSGSSFGTLVDGLGFFPAVFGQQPSPMLPARPRGELGPRYAVRYRVPTGSRPATITQTLYPYAVGGVAVYTRPGQPLFGMKIPGGWFRGTAAATTLLVKRGLPASAPGTDGGSTLRIAAWMVAVAAAAALAAFALSRLRRRPQPRPA